LSNPTRNNSEQDITLKSDVSDINLITAKLEISGGLSEFTPKNDRQSQNNAYCFLMLFTCKTAEAA
jgi:hypothetical protein